MKAAYGSRKANGYVRSRLFAASTLSIGTAADKCQRPYVTWIASGPETAHIIQATETADW